MAIPDRAATEYDMVVVGGAFSGAATAILLKRWVPSARVLVVEKQPAFDQKVGEATVELSAMFLHRVLGVYDELSRTHVPKHGLRYWFTDHGGRSLAEMSEIGPDEVPRLPAFQLDRAKMDEHLLSLARGLGVEVARPAKVTRLTLAWPESRVRIEGDAGVREVTCRWVVDASGRATMLARQLGVHVRVDEHPTAALWGRWSNVRDMDGPQIVGADPRHPRLRPMNGASRRLGTNHFCGYGWWCWVIPLGGGETSIGVVYNKELYDFPTAGRAVERYRAFVEAQPGLRELAQGATLDEDDFRGYGHLPYKTRAYAGRGWALVGDAAAFMDPYYSPGLDQASLTTYGTARIIEEDLTGQYDADQLDRRLARHNEESVRSYERWLSAIYTGKYEILGDAELTYTAFLMDTAMYYLAIVAPVQRDVDRYRDPVFGRGLMPAAAYRFMRFFKERLTKLARERRARGIYGRRNVGWNVILGDVGLGTRAWMKMGNALQMWALVELQTLLAAPSLGGAKPRAAVEPSLDGASDHEPHPQTRAPAAPAVLAADPGTA